MIWSMRGVMTLWFGIAGLYLALTRLPLQPEVVNFLLGALILSGVLAGARIAGDLANTYARRGCSRRRCSPR